MPGRLLNGDTPPSPSSQAPAQAPAQEGQPPNAPPPSSTVEVNPHSAASSTNPGNPSELPPAALDLAAKLFDFARQGATAELQQYLDAGIPANLTNHAGDTLLMLSAYHGNVECTRMLLGKGADANQINGRGQSPLAGACFKGFKEIVEVLVREGNAGLDVGQPNAVDTARMFRRQDLLDIMGVDVEADGGGGNVSGLTSQYAGGGR